MGPLATLGQHDVVLPLPLMLRDTGYCLPHHCAVAAILFPHVSSGICQVSSTGKFPFERWVSHKFAYICQCLLCCMLSTIRCHAVCQIHQWGLNHWGLHHSSPSEHTHGRHMCILEMVISPHQESKWLFPSAALSGGSLILLFQLFSSHYSIMVVHTALESWQSYPSPLPSLNSGEGSYFPGLVQSYDKVNSESVMGIQPGDSVSGWWVNSHLVYRAIFAHSHIYPGFTGNVSLFTLHLLFRVSMLS